MVDYPTSIPISVIALEMCNRGCRHCGVDAKPSLENPQIRDLKEWLKRATFPQDPTDPVIVTYGEPFNYPDLAQLIEAVLTHIDGKPIRIVTSGIDFRKEPENQAAQFLSQLPAELKRRTRFALSLSPYPAIPEDALVDNFVRTIEFMRQFGFYSLTNLLDDSPLSQRIKKAIQDTFGTNMSLIGRLSLKPFGRAFRNGLAQTNGDTFHNGFKECTYSNSSLALFPDGSLGPSITDSKNAHTPIHPWLFSRMDPLVLVVALTYPPTSQSRTLKMVPLQLNRKPGNSERN